MTRELSLEEEVHVQNLSVIPAAIVVYAFIGYLVYLFHNSAPVQLSFLLPYISACFILALTAFFLTWDLLYASRSQQPFASRIKPFLGKMSVLAGAFASFGAIYIIAGFALSPIIYDSRLLLLTAITWSAIWGALVLRSRQKLDRLSKGRW
ncbi:MAG TPA: hypothetical protein VK487_11345 [Candidatus Bathyarchaeia archaeon]|nr:hypothetical protein [Candidatus Bathyarchaeia archaeon]